jgi:hypothetical protein
MSNNPEQLNKTSVQLDVSLLDPTTADAPNWAVLMGTLYRLCDEHPGHAHQAGSNAKLWLIGRGLATGVERQINSTGGQPPERDRGTYWHVKTQSKQLAHDRLSRSEDPARVTSNGTILLSSPFQRPNTERLRGPRARMGV